MHRLALALLLLVGCTDDETAPTDAGANPNDASGRDGDVPEDTGQPTGANDAGSEDTDADVRDAGGRDGAAVGDAAPGVDSGGDVPDAGPVSACLEDHTVPVCAGDDQCARGSCVRGVCLEGCGETPSGYGDALGDGLTLLGGFCAPRLSEPFTVVTQANGCTEVFAYSASGGNSETDTYGWTLWRTPLNPNLPSSDPTSVGEGSVTRPGSGTTNFSRMGIQLTPDGTRALQVISDAHSAPVLYVQTLGTDSVTAVDEVSDRTFAVLSDSLVATPGSRSMGATFQFGLDILPIDDPGARAFTLLAPQGVESVAVLNSSGVVLVGAGTDLYSLALDDLVAAFEAGNTIDLASDARVAMPAVTGALVSDFRLVGDEFFVTWSDGSFTAEVLRRVTVTDSVPSFGPEIALHDGSVVGVAGLGEGRLMLSFFNAVVYARVP